MARTIGVQGAVLADVRAVLFEHDRCWTELDLEALGALWDTDDPGALYLGDENRDPVVGEPALTRHWSRLGTRLRDAEVRSVPVVVNALADGVVLVVMYVRWGFAGVEGGEWRHGSSWVCATLRQTTAGWRFLSYMERLSELDDGSAANP